MILQIPKNRGSLYTYFTEAPGDKKSNVKRIKVSPEDGDETVDDYEADDAGGDTDETEAQAPEEAEEEVTDYSGMDDSEAPQDETEDAPVEEEVPEETVGDYEADGDYQEGDEEDVPEETVGDYGAEEDYQEGDEAEAPPEEEVPQEEVQEEDDGSAMRKYNLYKDYMLLYNNIRNYIDLLDNSVKDDINANQVLNKASDKLKKISRMLNEYMTIKYMNAEYFECLAFFQTAIASVKMVIELLKNNKIYLKQ